ncbi:MFS transporter [Amycolatopsis sp. NPDC051716]|uniref:MFS transporter n=1 Tax=Amycolatopsis sp. NPDC051716 TaxID=3155804 RepID=UPI003448F580
MLLRPLAKARSSAGAVFGGLPAGFWWLWVAQLINRVCGFVMPLLAFYVTDELHYNAAFAGAVVAAIGIGSLVAGPFGGILADWLGHRPTLVGAQTATALGMVSLAYARSPWALLLGAFAVGVVNNATRPAHNALIAEVVPRADQTRAYSLNFWAINLGFSVAMLSVGIVTLTGYTALFWLNGATMLISAVLVAVRVPGRGRTAAPAETETTGGFGTVLRDRGFVVFVVAEFLVLTILYQSESGLPIAMGRDGFSPSTFGQVAALNGIVIAVAQLPLTRLYKRFPESRVLAGSSALIGIGYAVLLLGHSPWIYGASIVVWTLGEIGNTPTSFAIVARISPDHLRGRYQGLYQVAWTGSLVVAPLVGGAVINAWGTAPLWIGCLVVGVAAAAVQLRVGTLLNRRAEPEPTPREGRQPPNPIESTGGLVVNQSDRRPAVIVMSDLAALARQHRLITDIAERGLTPLVIVGPVTDLEKLSKYIEDETHPLSRIAEVRKLPGPAVDGVLASVQDWIADFDVRGVICSGEVFVDPAGALAEALGLPGTGAWAARVCRDKVMQRVILRDHGPVSRAFAPHQRDAVKSDVYPCVVKPAGRMFSSGVFRVADEAELRAALTEYGPEETILVEELVSGPEFSVEALVHHGEVVWSGVTGKLTNEDNSRYFTEIGHTSPAAIPLAESNALVEANTAILKALRFGSGITHAEFRLRDGQPVLMEIAARLPGDAIMMLWHLATGRPLEPAMVDLALGVRPEHPAVTRRAVQRFVEHHPGRLTDVRYAGSPVSWISEEGRWPTVEPSAAEAPSRCASVMVGLPRGASLGPLYDSNGRSACVVADLPWGADPETEVAAFVDRVELTIEAEPAG